MGLEGLGLEPTEAALILCQMQAATELARLQNVLRYEVVTAPSMKSLK